MLAYKLYDEYHELGYFRTFYGALHYLLTRYYDLEVVKELKAEPVFMNAYRSHIGYDSLVVDFLQDELIYLDIINIQD